MKTLTLFIALGLALTARSAEPPAIIRLDGSRITPAEIDATALRLMKAAEVPGLGIAIINAGKIVFVKAYGVRDQEKKLPLTADSVMSGASLSKVAFAYLVMQLVDEGRLDLDKPVQSYLPKPLSEYDDYRDLASDPRYERITGRMLLSHTTGFPNWRWFEPDRKLRIHFEPGSRYAYSGEGIVLLQFVVEVVTGAPLIDLMQKRVFQPLAMTRTSMVWRDHFESDYANGYDDHGRSLGPLKRTKANAAGSMQTTLGDFARFMQAVMSGQGIRKTTREQMLSPQIRIASKHQFPTLENENTDDNQVRRLSYGLGWGLYWTPYGKAFFKEGHDDGWRHYAVGFDDQGTGLVIMSNSGNAEGIFEELLEETLKNTFTPIAWEGFTPYNQLPPRAPLKQHKQARIDAIVLERYVGRYGEPPNLILTIRRDGDHLSVQENDEPRQALLPESEKQFFSGVTDDTMTVEVDNQGHPTALIVHADGRDIPLKRIN